MYWHWASFLAIRIGGPEAALANHPREDGVEGRGVEEIRQDLVEDADPGDARFGKIFPSPMGAAVTMLKEVASTRLDFPALKAFASQLARNV